jgi:hypothetical protein
MFNPLMLRGFKVWRGVQEGGRSGRDRLLTVASYRSRHAGRPGTHEMSAEGPVDLVLHSRLAWECRADRG